MYQLKISQNYFHYVKRGFIFWHHRSKIYPTLKPIDP
jgi:hypothetical protein